VNLPGILDYFFDSATWASESVSGRVGPTCQREAGRLRRCGNLGVLFSFGIFRAAVFAEPAVTEIEKMIGLIHKEISEPGAVAIGCFQEPRSDQSLPLPVPIRNW
jgi:hypothetical protein